MGKSGNIQIKFRQNQKIPEYRLIKDNSIHYLAITPKKNRNLLLSCSSLKSFVFCLKY